MRGTRHVGTVRGVRTPLVLTMLLVAVAAGPTGLAACGGDDGTAQAPTSAPAAAAVPVPEGEVASPAEYRKRASAAVPAVKAGTATLIDVRTRKEWNAEHARRATLLPLDDIQAGAVPQDDVNATIYVYCRSGRRAETAVQVLRAAGFTNVTNIGGLADWKAAGGKTT